MIFFQVIKDVIINNVVVGANPNLQFYLLVNTLQTRIGKVLFQIKEVGPGIEFAIKFAENEPIVIFLSY